MAPTIVRATADIESSVIQTLQRGHQVKVEIGSDEQNLDIPKRLESTCGAVVRYASGTCATAAQGLKRRGMRIIRVSSKQSGVFGVNWNRGGAWTAGCHEGRSKNTKVFLSAIS